MMMMMIVAVVAVVVVARGRGGGGGRRRDRAHCFVFLFFEQLGELLLANVAELVDAFLDLEALREVDIALFQRMPVPVGIGGSWAVEAVDECLADFLELDARGIAQAVEGVLGTAGARGDIDNHDHLDLVVVVEKGLAQDRSELCGAEGHMAAVHVHGADAFLECKQRLVDFCTLEPGLPVGIHCVDAALTARQINQTELAKERRIVIAAATTGPGGSTGLERDLEDSVRARALIVCRCCPNGPCCCANVDCLDELCDGADAFLRASHDAHCAFCVLIEAEPSLSIEQIKQLSSVDFIVRHKHTDIFCLVILVSQSFKDLLCGHLINP
eukprot:comp7911_c0_seq1/m.8231 comp7911_c0_seq1/g.8231  ORF comp7911_c0_seq1/g.8231 comp7911_c0_seq1/m.8231 type:complete len:328 (-) comp7911_c0_seq1:571-1554(-)